MTPFQSIPSYLSGSLLVAHPGLLDPNFRRKVVLISSHSEEDGALGVIVNWSLEQKLEEFDPAFGFEPLGKTPLYRGGPVAPDQVIFAAWKWAQEEEVFRLAFGISPEQARSFLVEDGYEVRAFLGYAGWGRGQLEEELAQRSWLVTSVDGRMLGREREQHLWRKMIGRLSPEMKILADSPEDPSVN